jgi:diacylglycerol O-acyltransferase
MDGTRAMKAQMGTFGDLIPKDFPSLGSPWLLSGLASLYGRSGLAKRLRVANVTISNVPGPQVPLYLAGAQMAGLYPLSIVVHGVALNITVQSYMGQLCFGLIACRRAMPDVKDLAAHLERAIQAARALQVPDAAAEAPAPAPTVPTATKRRKPRLAVVKAVPVKTPLNTPRAAPARARRRAA